VVPALTPYVEAHSHFEAGDPEGSVRAALAAVTKQNAAMVLLQMPPDTFDHPGHYDAEVILAEAKKHADKIAVLGGGGSLNAMIIQAAATGRCGPAVQKKFRRPRRGADQLGVVGFGEMTAEHYAGGTPYQYCAGGSSAVPVARRHRGQARCADRSAHGGGARGHGGATDREVAAQPADLARQHRGVERLLAHNPRAKIIWAHLGADGTGKRTPELCRSCCARIPTCSWRSRPIRAATG